jgi:hypothetical protein
MTVIIGIDPHKAEDPTREVSHPSGVQGLLPHIRLDACSLGDVIRPCACTYAL